jgi:hypothetical protein
LLLILIYFVMQPGEVDGAADGADMVDGAAMAVGAVMVVMEDMVVGTANVALPKTAQSNLSNQKPSRLHF